MANLFADKRFLLALLLVGLIAASFWAGSRYPALNEKAALGGGLMLEDPLGFDPLVHLESGASFIERIGIVTINWLYTNRQGMAFGVLLAAAIMTLFALLRRVSFEGTFANTLLGVVVGAPLGVCVNCAAPIARGLHASGARVETALAAMVSSPTLNVIVLTMLFSLFPLYLVVVKLGTTLLFLLVAIPFLARFVFRKDAVTVDHAHRFDTDPAWAPTGDIIGQTASTWSAALRWVGREFARHLWFITRTTVPLMFLAGFLGAVTITAVPWDTLTANLPYMGRLATLATMGAIATIGLILPVPMAFDVVVAAALFAAGVPIKYVGVLLFTLGIFSIYSFMIVGQAISWRVSTTVSVALLGLGMVSGVAAHVYGEYDNAEKRRFFLESFQDWDATRPAPTDPPAGSPVAAILASLQSDALTWTPSRGGAGSDIVVERRQFQPRAAGAGPLFSRHDGGLVGLVRTDDLPVAFKFSAPFYRSNPIASGDVHGDGWPDILLGSDRGLSLFANHGGRHFERQRIAAPGLAERYIVSAALVDLNDDGWLDIVATAYRGGNFLIYNHEGNFTADGYRPLPADESVSVDAIAFGDLDRNGRLEIALGNWSTGSWTPTPPSTSRNVLLRRHETDYRAEPLPGAVGETLSLLMSDIDSNGTMDLLVGNDFSPPDTFLLGTDAGLRAVTSGDALVPRTTRSTMSIDSADIDNDLRLEIFLAQVTGRSPAGRRRLDMRATSAACDELTLPADNDRCRERMAVHEVLASSLRARRPARCLAAETPLQRADCVAYHVLQNVQQSRGRNGDLCAQLPDTWERIRFICEYSLRAPHDPRPQDDPDAIRQIFNANVLLQWTEHERLEDRAVETGIDVAGWAWNGKFADLDHDEWQDLYVVNGHYSDDDREPNMFFRNRGDGSFALDRESGLGSYLVTATYTYVDIDDDGDLDMVEVASDGPVWLYRNNQRDGHAIVFEIRDEVGNAFGIGTRLIIHYGDDGTRHQVREIKASGGFHSLDAPQAHFGLGTFDTIARVEIWWSTGERTTLQGPFEADHRYRVTRTDAATADARSAPPEGPS